VLRGIGLGGAGCSLDSRFLAMIKPRSLKAAPLGSGLKSGEKRSVAFFDQKIVD
jgi:hypothetical protein